MKEAKSQATVETYHAYVWQTGLIEIGRRCPEGAICIASGGRAALRSAINRRARLSYKGKPLVPGIPEAATPQGAIEALRDFSTQIKGILAGKTAFRVLTPGFNRLQTAMSAPAGHRPRSIRSVTRAAESALREQNDRPRTWKANSSDRDHSGSECSASRSASPHRPQRTAKQKA